MITTLLNIENVATMVCRVPGKEELGGASVGLESWDMDERSEEHTSELQSHSDLVCRLLLETKKHTSELQSHSDLVCRLLLEKKRLVSRVTEQNIRYHTIRVPPKFRYREQTCGAWCTRLYDD